MPPSVSQAWILRPPSGREFPSCQCCSTTSPWRSNCRLCSSPLRNTAARIYLETTQTWQKHSAAMASGWKPQIRLSLPSNAESRKQRKGFQLYWNSSQQRKSTFPCSSVRFWHDICVKLSIIVGARSPRPLWAHVKKSSNRNRVFS